MEQLRRHGTRALLLAAIFAVGGFAQLPPDAGRTPNWIDFAGYFESRCPEGCRDIDAYVSCGSVEDVAACSLAVDGNVSLTCTDGGLYTTTMVGCHSGVNQTQLGVAVSTNFELWTMRRFATNFGVMLEVFDIPGVGVPLVLTLLEFALAFVALCVTPHFPKVLPRAIIGAIAGLVPGHLCLALGNIALGPWYTVIPLVVFVPVTAVLSVRFVRVSVCAAGATLGLWVAVVLTFEAILRHMLIVPRWVFYAAIAVAAAGGYAATRIPTQTRVAYFVLLGATCITAGIVQLVGPLLSGGSCTAMSTKPAECGQGLVEALYVVVAPVCLWVHVEVMKRALRKMGSFDDDGNGLTQPDATTELYGDTEMTRNYYGAI